MCLDQHKKIHKKRGQGKGGSKLSCALKWLSQPAPKHTTDLDPLLPFKMNWIRLTPE